MFEVVDDCINTQYQNHIENILRYDTDFRWVYHDDLTNYQTKIQTTGFSHMFLLDTKSSSNYSGLFIPLLYEASSKLQINIDKMIRGRCFLQTPGVISTEYDGMHVDLTFPHLVCLYYASDSDGDTYFSERMYGEPIGEYDIYNNVSPKKGRCVFFDGLRFHASSRPTQKSRFVINYNFTIR